MVNYKILCDNHCIYDTRDERLKLIDPTLNLEVNTSGSLDFSMYYNHPYYNSLQRLKSKIEVYKNDKKIFKGRILDDDSDFHNTKKIYCEGSLAYLEDVKMYNWSYSGTFNGFFSYVINFYNSKQVDPSKRFKIGNITVTDPNDYVSFHSTEILSCWEVLKTRLLENYGGYINVRYSNENNGDYIDYLIRFTDTSNQQIKYGSNLIDLKQSTKGADIKTVIIPYGAKINDNASTDEKRVDISGIPNETKDDICKKENMVYSISAVEKYGWIYDIVFYDNVTIPNNLYTKAKADLLNTVNLTKTIELNAIDLSLINEDIDDFNFCDIVHVTATPQNVDENFLLSKIEIPISRLQDTKITLGSTYKTLVDTSLSTKNDTNLAVQTIKEVKNSQMTNENVVTILNQEIPNSEVFIETVSDILKNYDFSEKVSNILKDYDFSEKILNTLKTYNFYNIVSVVSNGITTLSDTNITNVSMKPNIIIGNKLSVSSKGEVIIGDNVNNIKVSTGIYIDSEFNESDIINISIQKNNTIVYSTMEKIIQNGVTIYGGLNVIGVKKGDIIKLCIQNETFGRGKIGGNNTFMNVEAI